MKRYLLAAGITAFAAACGGADEVKSTTPTGSASNKPAVDSSNNPDYQKGLTLVAGGDCLSCHHVKTKLLGPSFNSIADKYESNAENIAGLADKIIKGSQGVWGQVPMTPHPAVKKEDAAQMVKYILLLKTKQ